jgi:hypothetical protein
VAPRLKAMSARRCCTVINDVRERRLRSAMGSGFTQTPMRVRSARIIGTGLSILNVPDPLVVARRTVDQVTP